MYIREREVNDMKWNTPEITELKVNQTEQGGKDFTVIDYSWKDDETGLAYSSYQS